MVAFADVDSTGFGEFFSQCVHRSKRCIASPTGRTMTHPALDMTQHAAVSQLELNADDIAALQVQYWPQCDAPVSLRSLPSTTGTWLDGLLEQRLAQGA
jgi:hypothetical protein